MTDQISLELTYHEIARRRLLKQSRENIAQATGLRLNTLQAVERRPAYRRILDKLRDKTYTGLDNALIGEKRNLRQEIQDVAEDSFDVLKDLLHTAAGEGVRVNIGQDFMDRAGYHKAPAVPVVAIQVNRTDAEVITEALDRERKGRIRLEKLELDLALPREKIKHPMLKKHGDNSTIGPSEGAEAESD